jgi:hypothetical protein
MGVIQKDTAGGAAGVALLHASHGAELPAPELIDVETLRGRRAVRR